MFFSLLGEFRKDEVYVAPIDGNLDFMKLFKGSSTMYDTIIFKQKGGEVLYDLIITGFGGLYILSDNVYETLIKNGVTGWSTYPIEIFDKSGFSVDGYQGLSVTGKCGKLDESKSIIISKISKGQAINLRKGLYFDKASWDGSDIFSPEGSMHTFVTERVVNLLSKFSNMVFDNIKDIERFVYLDSPRLGSCPNEPKY